MVAERDHLTAQADALRVFDAARQEGAGPDLWIAPGTHAFDAPGHDGFPSPMQYDAELAETCLDRFLEFLARTLEAPVTDVPIRSGAPTAV